MTIKKFQTYFDEARRISGARYHLVAKKTHDHLFPTCLFDYTYQHIPSKRDVVDLHKHDLMILQDQNHKF